MATKKQKISNVPNLRFPGFEGEWEHKKLANIVEFKVTNSFSRDNLNYEKGTVKNIHYGDIHTKFHTLFDVTREIVPYVNKQISLERISDDFYCKEGDIIFADASEDLKDVGKSIEIVNLNGEKLLSGLHTLLARPQSNNFHKGFSGYLFQSTNVRLQIQKEAQGSKVLSINVGRLSKLILSVPSITEQKKVAEFLSLIDERITAQSKIIEKLQTLIKGLSENLFSLNLRFKSRSNFDFPDWKIKTLGDIGKTYNGLSGKTKDDFGNGKSYIQYKQIFDCAKIQIENCGLVEITANESQNRVRFGDIFFTVSSETPEEIGMSSVLLDEVQEIYLNSFCFGYRPNSLDTLNPFFARFLFRSTVFRNEIVKLAQGSTRYNMSKIQLLKIGILLPSLEEQSHIADFLSSVDEKIVTERIILKQFESQKRYVLQNLFI